MPVLLWLIVVSLGGSLLPGAWGQASRAIEAVAVLTLFVCALRPVADALLRPLELQHPPLDLAALTRPQFVAVLGAGHRYHRPELPAIGQLQPVGLTRLIEGVRIIRSLPHSRLVVCGCALADAACELGVDGITLASTTNLPSTQSELAALKTIVSSEPFVLVTTAAHMPRTVALCRALDLHPVPAPTDFMARRRSAFGLRAWLPTLQALLQSERALYEYAAWTRRRLFSR